MFGRSHSFQQQTQESDSPLKLENESIDMFLPLREHVEILKRFARALRPRIDCVSSIKPDIVFKLKIIRTNDIIAFKNKLKRIVATNILTHPISFIDHKTEAGIQNSLHYTLLYDPSIYSIDDNVEIKQDN